MWTRHENGRCVEFVTFDPAGKYNEALTWVEVPEHLRTWADHNYVVERGQVLPPSTDYLIDQLLGALAERGETEAERGVVMPDGYRVDTSKDSRSLLIGAFLRAQRLAVTKGPDTTITWKVNRRVFERAPASVVMARGSAVIDHVQGCIDREDAITTAILAAAAAPDATPAALIAVYDDEISAGWPTPLTPA